MNPFWTYADSSSATKGRSEQCGRNYSNLLNWSPTPPSEELIKKAREAIPDPSVNYNPTTQEEVAKYIGKLKNGKAAVVCNIIAEMFKAVRYRNNRMVHRSYPGDLGIWKRASGLEKSIMLPFYKGKGSNKECKNHRSITVPSVP